MVLSTGLSRMFLKAAATKSNKEEFTMNNQIYLSWKIGSNLTIAFHPKTKRFSYRW
jgi:hypothetical protein